MVNKPDLEPLTWIDDRSRRLNWLLPGLILICAVAVVVLCVPGLDLDPLRYQYAALILMAISLMAAAYWLNRRTRYRLGSRLAILSAALGTWGAVIIDRHDLARNVVPLFYAVYPLALASLFLDGYEVAIVASLQLVGVGAFAAWTGLPADVNFLSLIFFHTFATAIGFLVNIVTRRNRDRLERQTRVLAESEQRFRKVFEAGGVGIALIDLDHRFITVNAALGAILGYSADELKTRSSLDFTHPADLEATRQWWQDVKTSQMAPDQLTQRCLHKQGRVVWVTVAGSIIRGSGGEPLYCLAMVEDITARQQAEAALQAANNQLTAGLEAVQQRTREMALLQQLSSQLQGCRTLPEAYALFGRLAADLFPGSAGLLFAPAPASENWLPVAAWHDATPACDFSAGDCPALAGQLPRPALPEAWHAPCPGLGLNPETRCLCIPLTGPGRGAGVLQLQRPAEPPAATTAEEWAAGQRLAQTAADSLSLAVGNLRAGQALRDAQGFLQLVVDSSPSMIFVKDSQGRATFVNQATARYYGATPAALTGQSTREVHRQATEMEEFVSDDQEVIRTRQPIAKEELNTAPSGEQHWFYTVKVPLVQPDGGVAALGISTDITERKQAEAAIRRQAETVTALYETTRDLVSEHDLSRLLQTIVERAARLLNAAGGGLYLCEPELGQVRCVVSYHTPRDFTGMVLKYGEGAAGRVAQTRQPLIVNDYRDWAGRAPAYDDDKPFRAVVSVPMMWQDELLGVIHVLEFERERQFTEGDQTLVQSFANQAALAVQNARLHARGQQELAERAAAQAALQASRAQLAGVIESAIDGIITIDADQRILLFNAAAETILGCPAAAAVGQPIDQFIPARFREAHRSHVREFGETGLTHRVKGSLPTLVGLRASGAEFPMEASISRLDVGGQRLYTVIMRDVTERQAAEVALRQTEERFRALIDRALDLITIVNRDGSVRYESPAIGPMLGYGPSESVGHSSLARLHPDDLAGARAAFARIIQNPGETLTSEVRVRHRDGSWRVLEVRASNFLDHPALGGVVLNSRDITERKQAEAERTRRLAELEAVNRITTALRSAATVEEMLPRLLDETLAMLSAVAGAIWLNDAVTGESVQAVARGWLAGLGPVRLTSGEGIAGSVFTTGEAYLTREYATDLPLRDAWRPQMPVGWGGAVVPIRTAEVVGVLMVSVALPQELQPEQAQLLTTLAEIAGNAIHRMRLYAQAEQHIRRLSALRAIETAVTSSLDLTMTLQIVLDQVVTQLHLDAADVFLLQPGHKTLEYAGGRGFRSKAIPDVSLRLGQLYAGRVALEQRAVCVPDFDQPGAEVVRIAAFEAEGFRAYYAGPLIARGQVTGVLEVFQRAPFRPDSEWLDFLEAVAGQVAIAIDNARLFHDLQRSNLDLGLAYDATIEGWSRALDLRDKETEGHTQRVTELTERLARALGLGGDELVHLWRGALLHDIGKMGVPDRILLKPGPLADDEWRLMRQHPQYAYDMLAPIKYLRAALDIPYCHHEKWDGSGYPRGLKGDQIPLAARIFAVADVWDALISDRPYRAAWSREAARAYIAAQSGQHFEPRVVAGFLKLIDSVFPATER